LSWAPRGVSQAVVLLLFLAGDVLPHSSRASRPAITMAYSGKATWKPSAPLASSHASSPSLVRSNSRRTSATVFSRPIAPHPSVIERGKKRARDRPPARPIGKRAAGRPARLRVTITSARTLVARGGRDTTAQAVADGDVLAPPRREPRPSRRRF